MRTIRKISKEKEILKKVETGMSKVSPLITKALMEKFEQSSISPVFLVDNKVTELKWLNKTKFNKISSEFEKCNCKKDDFWMVTYNQTKHNKHSSRSCQDLMLIISRKSGKSKEYCLEQNWLNSFAKDIKNNYFQE